MFIGESIGYDFQHLFVCLESRWKTFLFPLWVSHLFLSFIVFVCCRSWGRKLLFHLIFLSSEWCVRFLSTIGWKRLKSDTWGPTPFSSPLFRATKHVLSLKEAVPSQSESIISSRLEVDKFELNTITTFWRLSLTRWPGTILLLYHTSIINYVLCAHLLDDYESCTVLTGIQSNMVPSLIVRF